MLMLVGCLCALSTYAQVSVSGQVLDASDNSPMPGVSVIVRGTTTGTVTDMDGNFALKAAESDVLDFSFIGYQSQSASPAANLRILLQPESQDLDDVVVIGYGAAKKNDLTGSVTAIKPDAKNHGLVTNAQDMISGKIAGVNVTSAGGTPGAGATIRIRGGSSLTASNDPLIVIDGLAMDNDGVKGLSNPLSMVNPADIESFTVLKDASATAIYGSRGSNGVIIITTKKGAKNAKPSIVYNGSMSVSNKKDVIDVMNGDEFRAFVIDLYGADSDAAAALGTANTDWQDEIYRTALGTDHNLTVSGGKANLTYRVSAGYTGQQGILDTSDFRRATLSVNLAPSFLDNHLTFNFNAKGMYAKSIYADTDAVGAAVWMDPSQSVKDDSDEYTNFGGYFQWLDDGTALNDPLWTKTFNSNATKNPVALLNDKDKSAKSRSFVGNIEGNYKIHGFEDLAIHGNFGWDVSTGKETTSIPASSSTNAYYGWDGWDQTDKYNLSINAYIQYVKDFNENNHFDIMAGYEWQHFHHEQEYDGWGLFPDSNNDVSLRGTQYNRNHQIKKSENYLVSFFGRLNYALLDRYLLTGTLRYDGSSRFKDHWALFPSVGFAWKVKQEAFLADVDLVSDAKVRLGYGQTGQQEGIGDYNYFASYTVNTGVGSLYPIVGDGTMYRPDAYNSDLKWETTETYNVGLDLGFADNRITFTGDYYVRKTTDLINQAFVAAGSNFRNQVKANIGSLENRGLELAITGRPLRSEDWQWELTLNAAYNKNEITKLVGDTEDYYVETGSISSGTGNYCQAHAQGHARSSYHVYQQVYDEAGLPIEGCFVDRNADGVINESDKYYYKSPDAPWTLGLASRLQYKNIDFSFSLRGSIGNYVYNDQEAGMSNISTGSVYHQNYLSNRRKDVLAKNWQTYDYVLSDYFVQNASFLKCDNITLGYSFNKLFSDKISGRVYASVTNVFTITDYKGLDPEVDGGIDNNIYPRPITAQVGLTLNF